MRETRLQTEIVTSQLDETKTDLLLCPLSVVNINYFSQLLQLWLLCDNKWIGWCQSVTSVLNATTTYKPAYKKLVHVIVHIPTLFLTTKHYIFFSSVQARRRGQVTSSPSTSASTASSGNEQEGASGCWRPLLAGYVDRKESLFIYDSHGLK